MKAGDLFTYADRMAVIRVTRVSRHQDWADIYVVWVNGENWTKRQPLINGQFRFETEPTDADTLRAGGWNITTVRAGR